MKADLIDSSLNMKADPAYIDLFYTDSYDEAIYQRIYANDQYFYNITITSFNESDPGILKNDKSLTDLLASFRMDYKGGLTNVTDISNVKYGLADYNNFVASDTTDKKYSSWEMKILPEWDLIQAQDTDPYKTEFGTGPKENVTVEISHPKDLKDVVQYGSLMKSFYESNFNPAVFSMGSAGSFQGCRNRRLYFDIQR